MGSHGDMSEREKMVTALKEIVVPALRKKGFKGSFPHFRRITESHIDLLSFMFSQWDGRFCVDVGKCPLEGIIYYSGKTIPPNKAKATCAVNRFRLGHTPEMVDYWFVYDETDSDKRFEELAREVVHKLSQAASFWSDNCPDAHS